MDFGGSFCIFEENRTMKKLITITILLVLVCIPAAWSQKFPSLAEIHDFDAGDEFHTLHFFCYNPLSFQLEQMTVIEKLSDHPALKYVIQKTVYDFIASAPPILCDTSTFQLMDTLVIENPDSIIFTENDIIRSDPDLYNGRIHCIHSYWIIDARKQERYAVGCGMVFNGWEELPGTSCTVVDSMIYYSKGSEVWGNTLLGTERHHITDHFLIFPNPVQKELNIRLLQAEMEVTALEIFNTFGNTIWKSAAVPAEDRWTVNLCSNNFKPGLYFLYIRTKNGIATIKFIKN